MKRNIWILLLIILISCDKKSEFDFPVVYTGEVTDISADNVQFNAKIVDLGKQDIIEYGFVWSNISKPTIEKSIKCQMTDPPQVGIFSKKIVGNFKFSSLYHVRSYIKSSKYITYGNDLVFRYTERPEPVLIDFSPKEGNLLDTFLVYGHYLDYLNSKINLKIGGNDAFIVSANQDTIVAIVPENLIKKVNDVCVYVDDFNVFSADSFKLFAPVIYDFQPKSGVVGSSVIITGDNFLKNPASLRVSFGRRRCIISDIQDHSITIVVPSTNMQPAYFWVTMNNITKLFSESFTLL